MLFSKVGDKKLLNERSQVVLNELVDLYTSTGQPVGSKALCEISKLKLSPASIRNVMADLEDGGYLASPHTSAGRIPTEDGFRYYVRGLVEVGEPDKEMKKALKKELGSKNFKEVLSSASNALSRITSSASLVMAPRFDMEELEQVEFIRLSGDKVLAVLVTKNGEIENRVIHVPEKVSVEQLNESAKHLRDVVSGKTLADARVAMTQMLMEHKNRVDNMMSDMMNAAEMWGETTVTDGALVVSGSQNLFQYPELVRDQLKDLFHVFEEKRMLMALMNEVQQGDGVQIFIGKDCPLQAAKDCSLITTTYGSDDKKVVGTIGVIGPMRMDYRKTIQLVDYTGKLLSRYLNKEGERNV